MYKMLVVDDNVLDQEGIVRVLDWESLNIHIAGVCSDGEEALEQIKLHKPDIILTDIAMPVMSGIEMAKEVKKDYPEIKLIFMSCYDDFDFAKTAIHLDVEDYVLKPIIRSSLENAIKKTLRKFENENNLKREKEELVGQLNQSLPSFQEQFLKELIFGYYTDLKDIEKRASFLKIDLFQKKPSPDAQVQDGSGMSPQLENFNLWVASIEAIGYEKMTFDMDADEKILTTYSVKKIIGTIDNDGLTIYTIQISSKEFVLIVFDRTPSDQEDNAKILDSIMSIREEIKGKLNLDTRVGISKESRNILNTPVLYRQSLSAVKTKYCGINNNIVLFEEIEDLQRNAFEEIVDVKELHKTVRELIANGNENDIKSFVNHYIGSEAVVYSENYIKSFSFSVINILQLILVETNESFANVFGKETILWEKLNSFYSIKDIRQWILNVIKAVKEHLYSKNETHYARIVKDIKKIIESRYHEQITVNNIADSVFLSVGHANTIFRNETGKTIFEYLMEFRIDVAKKLLKDPHSRIYIIAEKTGYTNKSHFCLLFKKLTGMTPMEYKNNSVI